jgi:hypothetical protein
MLDKFWRRWSEIKIDHTEIRIVKRELDFSS